MGTLDDLIRERVSAVLDRVLTEKIDGALTAVMPFNSQPMPRAVAAKMVLELLGRESFASPDKAEVRISGAISDLQKRGYIRYGNPVPAHRVGEAY